MAGHERNPRMRASSPASREPPPALNTLLAGLSCSAAQSTVHWVETAKTRMQRRGPNALSTAATVRGIVRAEGAAALYKGYTPAIVREMSYSALRFGLYEPTKQLLGATDPKNTPLWLKAPAGAATGVVGSAVASPTDLFKVRMQAWEKPAKPLRWHVRTVLDQGGYRALYRGVSTTMTRAALLNGSKLASYDHIKHELVDNVGMADALPCRFITSILCGFCVATASAPVDLARTRIMSEPPGTYRGMLHCLAATVTKEGPLALWTGFVPQWLRFAPYAVVQFLTWEAMRDAAGIRGI